MRRRAIPVAGLGILALLAAWWLLAPTPEAAPTSTPEADPPKRFVAPVPEEGVDRARRRVELAPVDTGRPETPENEELPLLPVDQPGRYLAVCPLTEPADGVRGQLVFRFGEATEGRSGVEVRDRVLVLHVPDREGAGRVELPGYQAIRLKWHVAGDDGAIACDPSPLELVPSDVWLNGFVRNAASLPEGEVWVEGCGQGRHLVDEDGGFAFPISPNRACSVNAYRQAGMLRIWGDPVEVVAEDEDVEVELWVPEWAPAGMGISIRKTDDGIGVVQAHAGTPAAEAGLRPGDLVLEVDGEPTVDMTLEEFIEWGVGPEGSEVELQVQGEGGERTVKLTRRILE